MKASTRVKNIFFGNAIQICLAIIFAISIGSTQSIADNPVLQRGIKEYNAGNYNKALGLLGEAESAEFDNPVLHYYMANTLAHVDQKVKAIKEYKIALAIQPNGQLATYCHNALKALGAETAMGKGGFDDTQNQKPEIAIVTDYGPLSQQMRPVFADLKQRYGDQAVFTQITPDAIDRKAKSILQHYKISEYPTVLFF